VAAQLVSAIFGLRVDSRQLASYTRVNDRRDPAGRDAPIIKLKVTIAFDKSTSGCKLDFVSTSKLPETTLHELHQRRHRSPTRIQCTISPSERRLNLIVPVPGICCGFGISQHTAPYAIGNEKMSSISCNDPASGK
jgi:hypothetical protein